jgi:ATP-dependent protease ClpP protease subunit
MNIDRNLILPNVVQATLDGGSASEDRKSSNFVRNGKVYIMGDFDESISRYVIPDLNELITEAASQKDVTIPIYINSMGGEADKLQSILGLMSVANSLGIKIMTFVLGCAYSCASLLAVSGNVRVMASGARHMMHLGEIGSSSKTYEQLKRNDKDAKDFFNDTVRTYVEHTKMTEKQVKEILKDDMYWMDAKQCLKLGLCDTVV